MVTVLKIEKIDDNKIQISISIDDLIERNIDFDSLTYDSPEAQELFWDLMERAETELGFHARDAQLCIEAVPDENDTFVVTITKMDEDGEFESFQKLIKNRYKKNELRKRRQIRHLSSSVLMYAFHKMEDLKNLASRLNKRYIGSSTLYSYKNTYYLVLSKNQFQSEKGLQNLDLLVSEYGKKVNYISFYEGFLNEHGKKLSDTSAIDLIMKYY